MSEVTKEQAQKYDLTTLMIWGPEIITVKGKDGKVQTHNIHELINKRKGQLADSGIIISEAKLQVRITGDVKLEDIREYLSRFFDYTVVDIDMAGYSWSWRLEDQEKEFPTPWGSNVKATIQTEYNNLYYKIQRLIKEKRPPLKQAFEFLTSIPMAGKTTAFDRVRSMVFVKRNSEPDTTGRYTHALVFGCLGDCKPMLSVTSSRQDFEEFISFFQTKGYGVSVHLCTVELKPKVIEKYVSEPAEGYQRIEQCAVG